MFLDALNEFNSQPLERAASYGSVIGFSNAEMFTVSCPPVHILASAQHSSCGVGVSRSKLREVLQL
jgi:hypothetical protein